MTEFDQAHPIYQRDVTGCAIASSAWISGKSYADVKEMAIGLGIDITNPSLWSSTQPLRKILKALDINAGAKEQDFTSWDQLPDKALLAIKWHLEKEVPHWHWVVFLRTRERAIIMDPKKALKTNIRTDFGRIKPKWYIELT
ncbi:MAG: hypothetical protein MI743_10440 [Sneathiellales bacterium]|nr:hypothetical protein [Sneathiellales bacterium]